MTDRNLTQDQGKYFSSCLEEEIRKSYPGYSAYVVDSITYFCWEDIPAYFVILVHEADNSRIIEVVCQTSDGDSGPYPICWEIATHGWPVMSKEVWKYKE